MREESFMNASGSEKKKKKVFFVLKEEKAIKEHTKTKIMNVN